MHVDEVAAANLSRQTRVSFVSSTRCIQRSVGRMHRTDRGPRPAEHEADMDVFVVDAAGGQARQVTHSPQVKKDNLIRITGRLLRH